MGLVEVVTDVSNCNAKQEMNAPIIIGANGSFTSGDIDCRKQLNNKGGETNITVPPIPALQLMNLGLLQDFRNGLQTSPQYASQASPYVGQAMQYAAPGTYQNYAVPSDKLMAAKEEFVKSQGRWGLADAYAQQMVPATYQNLKAIS